MMFPKPGTLTKSPRGQTFRHEFVEYTELPDIITPEGRKYFLPDGRELWSVTTMLGRTGDDSWKEKWIARVGEDQARQVGTQAKVRGTEVHAIAEKYLLNHDNWMTGAMPGAIASFNTIRHFLDKNIRTVYGLELPLWSEELLIAGRTDGVVLHGNHLAIADFKTSKNEKAKDSIPDYFIQATAYAIMYQERYGVLPSKLIIYLMVDNGPSCEYIESTEDWVHRTKLRLGPKNG